MMSIRAKQAAYLNRKKEPEHSYRWVSVLVLSIMVVTTLFWTNSYLNNPTTLPVNKIRVHGAFVNVDEEMLYKAIGDVVAGGYFNVDVERVREVVEKLAWVDEASVRRVWPDTLSVSVVEQKPIAISKSNGLINAKGEVFKPLTENKNHALPIFDANVKLNKLMLEKYSKMNALLKNIERKIIYYSIDARHATTIKLDNGLTIKLGRDAGAPFMRLERFLSIYNKSLKEHVNKINVVDLRYTNGMAIAWKNNLKNIKASPGDMNHV